MFYTKDQDGNEKQITGAEPIYTRCPDCGQEMALQLGDMLAYGGIEVEKTRLYCLHCLVERERAEIATERHPWQPRPDYDGE